MDWQLIIGSGGLVGIGAIIFYLGRIVAKFESRFDAMDKRFEAIDKKFEEVYKRFDKIDNRLDKISIDLQEVKTRLDRLEVRVEERTLKPFSYPREMAEKNLANM